MRQPGRLPPGFMQPILFPGGGLIRAGGGFVKEPLADGESWYANSHYLLPYSTPGPNRDHLQGNCTSSDPVLQNASGKTYQAWIRRTGDFANATSYIIYTGQATGATQQCALVLLNSTVSTAKIYGYFYDNLGQVTAVHETSARTFTIDTWYHVAATFDPSQSAGTDRVKLYLNGTQLAVGTLTVAANGAGTSFQAPASSTVTVGGRYNISSYDQLWLLDEIRVHNAVLTGVQLAAEMSVGLNGNETNLVFLERFAAGNNFSDVVGSVPMARMYGYATTDNAVALPFA